MENSNILSKKMATLAKVMICGGSLFAMITLGVVIGSYFLGSGSAGELGPDLFLGLSFLVSAPTVILSEFTGLDRSPIAGPINSIPTVVIVNSLLGALLAAVGALIWRVLRKLNQD